MKSGKLKIETINDPQVWNNSLRTMPYAHILQTWEWGEFKRVTTGWNPLRVAFRQGENVVAMASIGIRQIGPLKVMYVPKGPAMDYENAGLYTEVFDYLQRLARQNFAVWLKIDPDVVAARGVPNEPDDVLYLPGQSVIHALQSRGWQLSGDQVQFRNTITLDLRPDEDALLAQMSQNTRRKVRTAEKKGVTVRAGTVNDLDMLYSLYKTTGDRDGFITRPLDYYRQAWERFMQAGLAHVLIAEAEGMAIAHVILFHFGRACWYFYGASANEQRDKMPNYLLQWEAIRWAKAQGYEVYDFWGAPDKFDESDSMWGVYEFKRGFRGTVTRHIGAWDYAPYPLLYRGYTQVWPRVLEWMKRRGS
jgi:lipid II:glycine glycyltransferase (peptidoglycan interpeptide bridge formation enzyme)